MTLTVEVSPETARRLEQAKKQGVNIETLLCQALEQLFPNAETEKDLASSHPLAPLAGKYEGDAWDELLVEIKKSRQSEAESIVTGE